MLKDNNKKRHIVIVGKGGGGGGTQVQSDWAQTDDTQPDYIKNKPEILDNTWFGTQAEYDAIVVKDPDIIYYIEDVNGSVVRDGKTYGIKVKIEEVQPNPYPDYLTVHYVVPEASNSFKILDNTSNISGWRIKGDTTWETPTTTISVNNNGTLVLEYNLTDSTKLARKQFQFTNVCKVEFPASLTTINNEALFNCRCLCEMPNLQNITYIGSTNFYSLPSNNSTYIIEDNVVRDWVPWGNSWKCSNYMLVNGRLLSLYQGSFENSVDVKNKNLDFSNGIDGHAITEWAVCLGWTTIPSLKFPTTLNKIWGGVFRNCTFTDLSFYNVTPPTQIVNGDNPSVFINCTFNGNIYVPADSVNAYQEAFPNQAQYITAMP